jgi:hypothetical protein
VLATAIVFAFSLTWTQNAAAQSPPILNNPAPATGSEGPPIVVDDCELVYRKGFIAYKNNGAYASEIRLRIEFTNESSKTADLIEFRVLGNNGSIQRDVGTFESGVEVTHEFTPTGSGAPRACVAQSVHFTDGTVWQYQTTPTESANTAIHLGVILHDDPPGVYVVLVAPGGLADTAGIRQGDRLVSIGSNAISSLEEVRAILEITTAGSTIPMVIERSGKLLNVEVRTGPATQGTSP